MNRAVCNVEVTLFTVEYADVAELVDALASGASALRGVEVQVLSSVPSGI